MKFPDAFLNELKARFRLSEYVGRTYPLKRSGQEYTALSPFVTEKTPSFFVNDAKAFFCCFASGKTGDVVDWVMEREGLGFVEAVKRLAEEAGMPLPERDERSQERDRRHRHLESVLGVAQTYFQACLRGHPQAQTYLAGRHLTEEDCSRFGIGYAPDNRAGLVEELRRAGFTPEDGLAAGVLATSESAPRPFDRYRHRITFPISDASGRPISFGARALDPKAKAKYLNGPDTELFDKGRNLYGLDMARKLLARGPGPLLVAEGYMDVIACLRAGIAACAPMGTSLTETQMDLMWRFHPEPTLCFDGDAAGKRAAHRAMDLAVPKIGPGKSLRFTAAVGGKDPDQVLREQGADVLRAQLAKATPLADAIFTREVAAAPLETPEQRAELRERLRKIVGAIRDRDLSREYGAAFKDKLEELRNRGKKDAPASQTSVETARRLHEAVPPTVSALAYWLVKDPARGADVLDALDAHGLGHPAVDPLVHEIVGWLINHEPNAERLAQHLSSRGFGALVSQIQNPQIFLAQPADWRSAYDRRVEYLQLEKAVREAKANCRTPLQMSHFMALKAQRDQAKRAL